MDKDTILKIAKLSNIKLTDEEIEMYTVQFQNILNYMELLEEVNVDGIEPYMTPITGNLRPDEVKESNMIDKKSALDLAAVHDEDYYLVPKVGVK